MPDPAPAASGARPPALVAALGDAPDAGGAALDGADDDATELDATEPGAEADGADADVEEPAALAGADADDEVDEEVELDEAAVVDDEPQAARVNAAARAIPVDIADFLAMRLVDMVMGDSSRWT